MIADVEDELGDHQVHQRDVVAIANTVMLLMKKAS